MQLLEKQLQDDIQLFWLWASGNMLSQGELKCLWSGDYGRITTLDCGYNSTVGSGGQVQHLRNQ